MPYNLADRVESKIGRQSEGGTRPGAEPPAAPARGPALLWGVAAIGLGLVAQFALTGGQPLLGALGLGAAVVLFVAAMRPVLAEPASPEVDVPEAPPGPGEAAEGGERRPRIWPGDILPAPGTSSKLARRWSFVRDNWRELTIAEIVSGSMPSLPRAAEILPPVQPEAPAVEPAAAAVAELPAATELPAAAELLAGGELAEAAPVRTARVTEWAGGTAPFSSPRAVAVTPQGDVLVLDVGREVVSRFDPQGRCLEERSAPGTAGVEVLDLAVSPDGDTLYVVDGAGRGVCAIALRGEE